MGVSESIIAASIGAGATLLTAFVQLMMNLRAQNKSDLRPKRNRTLRSIIAIVVLMIASGASGYLYAEYRHTNATQDLRAMREEINTQLQALTMTTERLAASRSSSSFNTGAAFEAISQQAKSIVSNVVTPPVNDPQADTQADTIEATVYVAGCLGECTEATAQVVPVCGSLPHEARVEQVDLYIAEAGGATANGLNQHTFELVEAEREFNATKFGALPSTASGELKLLCVEFRHWSGKPHFARASWRIRESRPQSSVSPLSGSVSATAAQLIASDANSVATNAAE